MVNSDCISLLAFLQDDADVAAMKLFATAHQLGEDCVFKGDIRDAAEYLSSSHESPNLLVVQIPSREEAAGLLDRLADVCTPETRVVIAGDINEYTFFMWLQEIGIFHYLLLPLTNELLEGLYNKASKSDEKASETSKIGKTIGIMGTRGGSGATSLAILLAAMVAEFGKKKTGLIELDPLDGTAALLLDVEPSHGFRESIEKPERLDEMFLERVMVRMTDHLSLISAEEDLSNKTTFTEEAAEALLPLLKARFAYTFLDISHHYNPFSLKIAQSCDQLFVISPMNLQGLRDAMRINEWLRDKCGITHQQFIGNKIGQMSSHEIIKNDFEKSLGETLIAQLPYSPEIFSEISNDLKVIHKNKEEGYSQLAALAKRIDPSLKIGEESHKKEKKLSASILKKK